MSDPNLHLDKAALAGWRYYGAGRTQDEIARVPANGSDETSFAAIAEAVSIALARMLRSTKPWVLAWYSGLSLFNDDAQPRICVAHGAAKMRALLAH